MSFQGDLRMKFKLGTLAAALLLATGAASATTISSPAGELSLNANIEIDNDYVDREGTEVHYRNGGRVEFNIEAGKEFGDKYVKGRGTLGLSVGGSTYTDDAWLEFGKINGLGLRVGNFEALDTYPLGMDIIVDFADDTLTPFDDVYIYRANELRGRGGAGFGQAMLFTPLGDNVRLELGALLGQNESFINKFALNNYENATGNTLVAEDGDAVGLRPGIEYKTDLIRLAAVAEVSLNSGVITEFDSEGNNVGEVSLSDRVGGGVSGSFYGSGYTLNANVGYLSADEQDSYSAALNAVIADTFGLGYIYAKNDKADTDNDPDSNTVYAAYALNNMMGIDGLAAKLGLFYSLADGIGEGGNKDVENKGARLRFNYAF
jgi:hypothetical protein